LGKGPLSSESEIYTLKYPNGIIIGKRAKKIIKIQKTKLLSNKKYYLNILMCIKGITKNTASLILNTFTIEGLLQHSFEKQELIELKKTPKSKIGKKIYLDLCKFLIKGD
jgi:hypothetical protein